MDASNGSQIAANQQLEHGIGRWRIAAWSRNVGELLFERDRTRPRDGEGPRESVRPASSFRLSVKGVDYHESDLTMLKTQTLDDGKRLRLELAEAPTGNGYVILRKRAAKAHSRKSGKNRGCLLATRWRCSLLEPRNRR